MPDYNNSNLGVTLTYPDNWKIKESIKNQKSAFDNVIEFAIYKSEFPADEFRDRAYLDLFNAEDWSVDEIVEDFMESFRESNGFHLISDVSSSWKENYARDIEFRYNHSQWGVMQCKALISKMGIQGIRIVYFAQEMNYNKYLQDAMLFRNSISLTSKP
jgi:hypothetical protein